MRLLDGEFGHATMIIKGTSVPSLAVCGVRGVVRFGSASGSDDFLVDVDLGLVELLGGAGVVLLVGLDLFVSREDPFERPRRVEEEDEGSGSHLEDVPAAELKPAQFPMSVPEHRVGHLAVRMRTSRTIQKRPE